ncbi:DegT/DnrJ/EryC1/StrS family aminotransferase [Halorientalis brevis]|uniref:DegT/DnrJ/EryC1/StrS family aminotransferase n=1 Tax=Halorientalis brevis TaxID=1126241 RepID=A0ABD6C8X3_9EURY|nr:DegT/DnrJ/EryC1/StrS family aminotransferase [Halorientalis brevis]
MSDQIPLFEIAWDEQEILNAVESIGRGGYWAKGPFVDKFESRLEEYLDVEHAIVVNSGTSGLVTALEASDIGPGDEVIVPSMTFIATANAVRLVGAEPVFADIDRDTYGLSPDSVRENITEDTAAIIPVHLYGAPCRIDQIQDIAAQHDLTVVEDAAEAFGSTYEGKSVGTFGDAGILSFCQNKIVVTGEGGAIITDDDEIASNARLYRSHGRAPGDYFESVGSGEYVALGTNLRMSDLTAAIGCAQMDKVDELIGSRQAAAKYMNEQLAEIDGVQVPRPIDGGTHVYQLYTVEFDSGIDRQIVIDTLDEHGVSSKIYWDTPVHETHYYTETMDGPSPNTPTTQDVADTILSLPIYPDLTPRKTDQIVAAVKDGVRQAR